MSNPISEDCSSGLHDYCTPCQCKCHVEYHTTQELYEHRYALWRALTRYFDNYITPLVTDRIQCWKSKLHADGTMFDDSFIVGMTIVNHSFEGEAKIEYITYHIPMRLWTKFDLMEIDRAPQWDGHTSEDVIKRLMAL